MPLEVLKHEATAKKSETPILFIHGAWHGAWCWDMHFLPYFAEHGYTSYALSLRSHGNSTPKRALRFASVHQYVADVAEVSMLAAYCAAPRTGHLEAVFHMFAYLKSHERSRLVFDPDYVNHIDEPEVDWSGFYHDAKESVPPDMPEPRGKEVEMTMFVDSDHAGDKVTRRSRTGILIFLNRAPILWYSKKQNSIETSSFGSEFMAMKTGVELLEGLRYKLRMMGVPIDGPAHVKADNMSVIKNSSMPESTLKKKSNSIAYHYVRERVAANVLRISYEPTESNLADMLTKAQPGHVRKRFAERVLF